MAARVRQPTLRIHIRQSADNQYRVELEDIANGGQVSDIFTFADAASEWNHRARTDPDRAGAHLAQIIFRPEFADFFANRLGRAPTGRVRVELCIHEVDNPLHAVQWELMHGREPDGVPIPLAANDATPFSRFDALSTESVEPLPRRQLRLLVAIASPLDLSEYGMDDVAVEPLLEALLTGVRKHSDQGSLAVTVLPGQMALSAPVTAALSDAGWQVTSGATSHGTLQRLAETHDLIYLTAHGLAGGDGLVLEAPDGTCDVVSPSEIEDRLKGAQSKPYLVFLATCYGGQRDGPDAFAALGPRLLTAGIPAVVAMQDAVEMEAARCLAADFFESLFDEERADGEVDRALNRARRMLYDRKLPVWAPPVLFCRLRDGRLYAAKESREHSTLLWVNVPPKPKAPLLGRDDLLADLLARLTDGHSPALSTDGLPGVGKTALAVALAHDDRVREVLSDGVLWGGLGVNPDVVMVQAQWAAALGVDLADEPDVDQRVKRLSQALSDRRVLVVIDDAWQIGAAQALRLSSPYVVHLLTTRDSTIARAFAGAGQQVHVPELEVAPAFALLKRLAPEACAVAPNAARALVKAVGELPLALEVLGGYLAGHDLTVFPDLAPEAFAALGDARQRLALATERLGGQPGKKETLEAAIRLSVEALPLEAAAAFWALGAFAPKPATVDRATAQAVTKAEAGALALLVGRNLVEAADGVLAVHQVVHDVMESNVPDEARQRYLDFYIHQLKACTSSMALMGVYDRIRYAAAFSETIPGGDFRALLNVVDMHLQSRDDRESILTYVESVAKYAYARGQRLSLVDWLAHRLGDAEMLSDSEAGRMHLLLGATHGLVSDIEQAEYAYQEAAKLLAEEDIEMHARMQLGLASVAAEQKRYPRAFDHLTLARTLADTWLKQTYGEKPEDAVRLWGDVYSASGQIAAEVGDWSDASCWLSKALSTYYRWRNKLPVGYAKVLEAASFAHWLHAEVLEQDEALSRARVFGEYRQALYLAEREIVVLKPGLLDLDGLAQAYFNLSDYAAKCSEDPALSEAERADYTRRAADARTALNSLREQCDLDKPAGS